MMDVFETLAEPTRRRIVELLVAGDRSVGELCDEFPISQPAVSRHLRVLRQARLVTSRVEAQRRVYSLRPEPLEEIDRWLERVRSFWSARLDDLGTLLEEEDEPTKKEVSGE
ncbi:MAG: metalloregulator ArsR/SmtB family transcription factor [Thermoanaerobaculia bacterium]|nr:metalloregulator ArsR/SmtB family transcription factor [Thermoanaerobaculia bacterium]